ncbi:hypothetical protein BH20ACT5_BH20ACT5_12360 [soil metagenome]
MTTVSRDGSGFASISVNGDPLVVADIEPNTEIDIPGVGTLFLHRVQANTTGIEVRMIELVITGSIPGILPNTVVQVAVARVGAS